MFKPKFGVCICHKKPNLIVVKAGFCKQGNEEQKNKKKSTTIRKKPQYSNATLVKKIKTKKENCSALMKELDDVFSLYIRNLGAKDGMNTCFTCGNVLPIKELQCGHYISRKHKSLRWYEGNCEVQDEFCNITLGGNYTVYAQRMTKKHGQDHMDMLNIRKHNTTHMGVFEYKILIAEYTEKLNKLIENNGK